MAKTKGISIGGASRVADARPDVADARDYIYQPALIRLDPSIEPRKWWEPSFVRNQNDEPSCTGHALASIIDLLRLRDAPKAEKRPWASARMLYSIARYHDRWPGEDYRGSSIRGVLKGFYFNGVCSIEEDERARDGKEDAEWHINRDILESARTVQLGAYFRVRARLSDVHAALKEVGVVLTSADIHKGWAAEDGRISFAGRHPRVGRHAFVIVGYDSSGFWVQNSWGREWGDQGLAHWSYDDWAANVIDMWVLRLGAPLARKGEPRRPQLASNRRMTLKRSRFEDADDETVPSPSRLDVVGHVVPLSRGSLERFGEYNVNQKTLFATARIIRDRDKYQHQLIHFMGLQEDETAAVAAVRETLPVFKENGVYPIFVMLENGLSEALHRMMIEEIEKANDRTGSGTSPEKDRYIEGQLSIVALRILEKIEQSATEVFRVLRVDEDGTEICDGAGANFLKDAFEMQYERFKKRTLNYHISAHGFGATLFAAMLEDPHLFPTRPVISSASLFAPLIAVETFRDVIEPLVRHKNEPRVRRSSRRDRIAIETLRIYGIAEKARQSDAYRPGYSGSWPDLWSQVLAFTPKRAGYDPTDREIACVQMLAIPENWQDVKDGIESEREIEFITLPANGEPERAQPNDALRRVKAPRHRDLDLRLAVLDERLSTILGKTAKPSFEDYYGKDRESFFER